MLQWKTLEWRSSWPLATCLAAADTPADLLRSAELLLANELGDTAEWRVAEKSWTDKFELMAVLDDLSDLRPWTHESIGRAPPFLAIPIWQFMERMSAGMRKPTPAAFLQRANQEFHASRSGNLKQRLAELCLFVLKVLPTRAKRTSFSPKEWVEAAPKSVAFLVPRPKSLPIPAWLKLLDACHSQSIHPWFPSFTASLDALSETPAHPVLLRLIVLSVEMYAEHLFDLDQIKPAQLDKAVQALVNQTATTPAARADMAILRLFLGSVSAEHDALLFQDIADVAVVDPALWTAFLSALHISRLTRPRINALLAKTYLAMGVAHPQAHAAVKQLRDALQKRTTDLDSHANWNRLALPLPYPGHPLQARLEGGIPPRPVRLDSVELRDIGGLHNLKLQLNAPA